MMGRFTRLLVTCAVVLACEEATAPPLAPYGFLLSGVVRGESGEPIPNATVEIYLGPFWGRTTTTDEKGAYRFESVAGDVAMAMVGPGHRINVQQVSIAADTRLDVVLSSSEVVASDTLRVGGTIRAVANGAPCDPVAWDGRAPCRRFYFRAPTAGVLSIRVEFGLWDLDAMLLDAGLSNYVGFSEQTEPRWVWLEAPLSQGTRYEIRVNSYYRQQAFDLRTEFRPTTAR